MKREEIGHIIKSVVKEKWMTTIMQKVVRVLRVQKAHRIVSKVV